VRLETVRGHNLGSLVCKPLTGIPSGRRMAARSTARATVLSRPRCTGWCSSTPPPSSNRAEATVGADLPQFVKDEFDAFLECGILAQGLPWGDPTDRSVAASLSASAAVVMSLLQSTKLNWPEPLGRLERRAHAAAHAVEQPHRGVAATPAAAHRLRSARWRRRVV